MSLVGQRRQKTPLRASLQRRLTQSPDRRAAATEASAELAELRRRVAAAEVLCEHSHTLMSAVQGEERAVTAQALSGLVEVLEAHHAHHFDFPTGAATRPHPAALDGHDDCERIRRDLAALGTNNWKPLAFGPLRHNTGSAHRSQFYLDWAAVPLVDHGMVTGALCIGREPARPWQTWELKALTSLAAAQQQMHQRLSTEAQLAAMFHEAPTGITLRDSTGSLIDCNQAFLDFLGLDSEVAILGTGPGELLASEELPDEFFEMSEVIATQRLRPTELPYRHHSTGRVIWGRASSAALGSNGDDLWITHVEDVTAEIHARRVTQRRATSDSLTGLANRHQLLDSLQHQLILSGGAESPWPQSTAISANSEDPVACGVVLLDLDGFKPINDTFGHGAGDKLLVDVGRRLHQTVRHQDLVGRYGGDEFLVILTGPSTAASVEALAARLARVFDEPFAVAGRSVTIRASVGLSIARAGDSPVDLIARADEAMYLQKARRRPIELPRDAEAGPYRDRRVLHAESPIDVTASGVSH